jgi:hypothetical protein
MAFGRRNSIGWLGELLRNGSFFSSKPIAPTLRRGAAASIARHQARRDETMRSSQAKAEANPARAAVATER